MICERCSQKNDPQALFCMRCGAALREATKLLSDDGQEVVAQTRLERPEQQDLELSFRIGNAMLMMPFYYQSAIILGREQHSLTSTILDPKEHLYPALRGLPMLLDTPLEFLDLTPYGAEEAGVSRKHLIIRHEGELVTVEDLDSRNGTYLNREMITPGQKYRLKPGDLLIVGKLIVSISFRTQAVAMVNRK